MALTAVMLFTGGCTGDALDGSKQLNLSANSVQWEKEAPSYTDTVANKLGSHRAKSSPPVAQIKTTLKVTAD